MNFALLVRSNRCSSLTRAIETQTETRLRRHRASQLRQNPAFCLVDGGSGGI
jgi:hypothetical protein